MNPTICYSMKHMDAQNSHSKWYEKKYCTLPILMEKRGINGPCYSYNFTTHIMATAAAATATTKLWARIDNWEKGGMWSTNITLKLPHIVKITLHKFHNLFYCWKYWRPYDDTLTLSLSLLLFTIPIYPYLCHSLSSSLSLGILCILPCGSGIQTQLHTRMHNALCTHHHPEQVFDIA